MISLDPSKLTTHHGRRRKCPPKALHNNMSPTRRRRRPLHLHWAVALMPPPLPQVETGRRTRHRRCPPRLPRSFFLHDFAPPRYRSPVAPSKEAVWHARCHSIRRFHRRCRRRRLDILCCGHRHLSRCTVASLVAPPPLSPRRRHYCRANAFIIAPLSRQRLVVASSPLSLHQSLCAAVSLFATSLIALQ